MATAELNEEATSHIADLGWTKVHYNEIGSGEALVLIHGGGLGATSWSNFILNIGPLSEHYRVLAFDSPGFGKSAPIVFKDEPGYTVRARAIKDLITSLNIERVSLIGNSMGGATALTFAVDYPERINKIVMMGAAPVGQVAMFTPIVPTDGIRALMHLNVDPSFESFRAAFDLMVYDGSKVPDDVLKRRTASVDEVHRKNNLASAGAPSRSILADLPNVEAPVLLIHGRNDTMSPLELSMALLPLLRNAELHVFNQCGHWAQYEHTDKFNRMVLDFLQHDD